MKKTQSAKARAASIKNLEDMEAKQAMKNRLSDNKEMLLVGFVIGSVVMLLGGLLGYYLSINL